MGGSSRLAVLYQCPSSAIPALCSSVGTCRQIGSTKKRFQRLLRSDFPSRQLLPLKGTSLPGKTYIFRSMWCSTSHPSRQQTGGVSSDDVLKLSKFGESSAPIPCLSASDKPASSFEAPQDFLHILTVRIHLKHHATSPGFRRNPGLMQLKGAKPNGRPVHIAAHTRRSLLVGPPAERTALQEVAEWHERDGPERVGIVRGVLRKTTVVN